MNVHNPLVAAQAASTQTNTALGSLDVVDGVPRVDSRVVAVRFGKRHTDVLRAIRTLLDREPGLALRNFAQGSYTVPETGSQLHLRYLIDRDGFSLLGMGFTGDRALQWKLSYIAAFNAMEEEIRRRQAPALDLDDNQILRRLLLGKLEEVDTLRAKAEAERQGRIAAEEDRDVATEDFLQTSRALTIVTHRHEVARVELDQKSARVEALQPKALAYDRIAAARGSDLISTYAKDVGMTPDDLFDHLDWMGWIMRRGRSEFSKRKGPWLGTEHGLKKGYVEHDTTEIPVGDGRTAFTSRQVMITAKGKALIDAQLAQGKLALKVRPKA